MFFYQFMHSSESILGIRENFNSTHPSGVYTFFQKLVMISEFFKEKMEVISFHKHVVFLLDNLYYLLFSIFFPSYSFLARFLFALFFS